MSDQPRPDQPLVTIVLPTYNGARYLEQSVRSCLDQTFRDWELIIVDDCSTDATPDIVRRFCAADARIRSVRHEANKRLPGGLNTGFSLARGRYFTWTSDDNLYRPDAIAEMVAYLDAHPDVGLVYAGMTEIDEEGNVLGAEPARDPRMLAYTNVVRACFMYRREVAARVGAYDERMFCAEDWDYWLRISHAHKLGLLQKDLYVYRIHPGTLSATRRDRVERAMADVLSAHLPRLAWCPRADRAQGYLVMLALLRGRGEAGGMRALLAALRLAPVFTIGRAANRVLRRLGRARSAGPERLGGDGIGA